MQTKKRFSTLLLLLMVLYFSGCNQNTIEAQTSCYLAKNGDTMCDINVSSITGDTNYIEFKAPPSRTDVSLYLALFPQEGGGVQEGDDVKVWIEDSQQHITKLVHYVDTVTMPDSTGKNFTNTKRESWSLSGQAKVEQEFGQSIFKIYLEPRRGFLRKKIENISMRLRYKMKKS